MIVISSKVEIDNDVEIVGRLVTKKIERMGRISYQSSSKKHDSDLSFAKRLIKNGHESVLEHYSITVMWTVDRGSSHQLVRHRLFSFIQESSRYVKYSHGLTFILPRLFYPLKSMGVEVEERDPQKPTTTSLIDAISTGKHITGYIPDNMDEAKLVHKFKIWFKSCRQSEENYLELLGAGTRPEDARTTLNHSLKTQIGMTGNLRMWRHFLKLRTDKHAQPDIRLLAQQLHKELKELIPVIFDEVEDAK